MRVRTTATQKLWPFCGIVVHVQGCAPRKVEGIESCVLNPCEIQGAQHMMSTRKHKFSSHLLGQLKLGARGHWALLELSLDVAVIFLFLFISRFFSVKKKLIREFPGVDEVVIDVALRTVSTTVNLSNK